MKRLIKRGHYTFNLDTGILLFRVFVSVMMLTHGFPKLMKFFSDEPIAFAEVMGLSAGLSLALAVFAEVICSLLLLLGFVTRLALIPLIITMVIVVMHIHGADPLAVKEKAILFLLSYVILFFTGSGKYSLDHMMHGKRSTFRSY